MGENIRRFIGVEGEDAATASESRLSEAKELQRQQLKELGQRLIKQIDGDIKLIDKAEATPKKKPPHPIKKRRFSKEELGVIRRVKDQIDNQVTPNYEAIIDEVLSPENSIFRRRQRELDKRQRELNQDS